MPAIQVRRSRLEKCFARRAELEVENLRIASELSRSGVRLNSLSPEARRLLRKLGAQAIEIAEINREVRMLTSSRDSGELSPSALI